MNLKDMTGQTWFYLLLQTQLRIPFTRNQSSKISPQADNVLIGCNIIKMSFDKAFPKSNRRRLLIFLLYLQTRTTFLVI